MKAQTQIDKRKKDRYEKKNAILQTYRKKQQKTVKDTNR